MGKSENSSRERNRLSIQPVQEKRSGSSCLAYTSSSQSSAPRFAVCPQLSAGPLSGTGSSCPKPTLTVQQRISLKRLQNVCDPILEPGAQGQKAEAKGSTVWAVTHQRGRTSSGTWSWRHITRASQTSVQDTASPCGKGMTEWDVVASALRPKPPLQMTPDRRKGP